MIERYVFVKLKDDHATEEARREVAAYSKEALEKLPGPVGVVVGVPAPGTEGSWDLSIVVRFERFEDIEPYRVHPDHRAYVDEYLRPRMEVIKAWNFTLT